MPELLDAALDYAVHGWPVMPVKPHGKEPASSHGVKDATTDERTILQWWTRWPDANIGIACGAPGPTVLDVDRPNIARPVLEKLKTEPDQPPTAATARGRHLYFNGEPRGTVSFDWGELRGRGSYVIAPPSTHPSGKAYVWLLAPTGPLPKVPALLIPSKAATAGTGAYMPPEDLVKHGQRHDFLKDIAVRTVRTGITDVPTIVMILMAAYETRCVKRPKAKPDEFQKLAEWAAGTDIATRERTETAETDKDYAPGANATLGEHRRFLANAGGWGPHVDIQEVRRKGGRQGDGLEITLTNGLTIRFARQEHVTTRGHWQRTVIGGTNGIADPPHLKEPQLFKVYRSLCVLADAPPEDREAEDLADAVRDYISLCEPITDHDLTDPGGRYDAIARCRARDPFDPKRSDSIPVVVVDRDGTRYLRGGELRDFLNHRGLGVSSADLPGRMFGIGFEHVAINGRETARPDQPDRRRTNRMILYRMP